MLAIRYNTSIQFNFCTNKIYNSAFNTKSLILLLICCFQTKHKYWHPLSVCPPSLLMLCRVVAWKVVKAVVITDNEYQEILINFLNLRNDE